MPETDNTGQRALTAGELTNKPFLAEPSLKGKQTQKIGLRFWRPKGEYYGKNFP